MLRQIILLLVIPLALLHPLAGAQDQLRQYEDADAYDVYLAILPLEWPLSVANAKALVIAAETSGYKMCIEPEGESKLLIGTAIDDYVKQNVKKLLLQRKFGDKIPYNIVGSKELTSLFDSRGGWDAFYKKYPDSGGMIGMSAVGFNADKTIAVVYMGHGCGLLCGGGELHVLQKKDGKWIPLVWNGNRCGWAS